MKFRIGDKVRYLSDVGGGTITGLIDNDTVRLLNEYEFEVPAPVNELVLVEGISDADTEDIYNSGIREDVRVHERDEEDDKEETDISIFVDLGGQTENDEEGRPYVQVSESEEEIYGNISFFSAPASAGNVVDSDNMQIMFALVPARAGEDRLDAYLVNDSSYELTYMYYVDYNGMSLFRDAGILENDTKLYLESFRREDMAAIHSFLFRVLPFSKAVSRPYNLIDKGIMINPAMMYKDGYFVMNDYFDEPAMIREIAVSAVSLASAFPAADFSNIIGQKEAENEFLNHPPELRSPKKAPVTEEVDLHIQNLVDYDYRRLGNAEILNIQMEHFRKIMHRKDQPEKIVFIHGIGSGTLKMILRKALDNEFPHLKYQDASFREYGFGATLVIM